jgi:hypothetical protein
MLKTRYLNTSLFILCLFFSLNGISQNSLTFKAENQPLNIVLSNVSTSTKVRFAYDDDNLSKIKISISVKEVKVEEFLRQLAMKYPVKFKLIGNTWVVYKDERLALARPKSGIKGDKNFVFPVLRVNPKFQVARLWDISGKVVDSRTGNSLKHAKIHIDEFSTPGTDDYHFFHDEIVNRGKIRMKVRHVGYHDLDTLVFGSDNPDFILSLIPNFKAPDGMEELGYEKFVLGITDNPNIMVVNANMLQYVTAFPHSNSTYNNFHIFLDGVELLGNHHFLKNHSFINSSMSQQITITRRGDFPNSIGLGNNIFEFSGKTAREKVISDVYLTPHDASLFIGVPLGRNVSFSASAKKSFSEYFPSYYFNQLMINEMIIADSVPKRLTADQDIFKTESFDVGAKVSYHPGSRNEVELFYYHLSNKQDRESSFLSEKAVFRNRNDYKNDLLGIRWNTISKSNWKNQFVLSMQQVNDRLNLLNSMYNEVDSDELFSNERTSAEVKSYQLKWQSEKSGRFSTHRFGGAFNYDSTQATVLSSQRLFFSDSLVMGNAGFNGSLFYDALYSPYNWVKISAGIELLYNQKIASYFFSPRLSAHVDIAPRVDLQYNYRQFVKPNYNSLFYSAHFNPFPVQLNSANENQLATSNIHSLLATYNHKGLQLLAGANYSEEKKNILFCNNNSENGNKIEFVTNTINQYAAEVMINYQHGYFTHSAYYIFNHSTIDLETNGYEPLQTPWQNKHQIAFNELVRISGWNASLSAHFYSEMPYLKRIHSEGVEYAMLPESLRLNATVSHLFYLKKSTIEAGVSLTNTFIGASIENLQHFGKFEIISKKRNYIPSFYLKMSIN